MSNQNYIYHGSIIIQTWTPRFKADDLYFESMNDAVEYFQDKYGMCFNEIDDDVTSALTLNETEFKTVVIRRHPLYHKEDYDG